MNRYAFRGLIAAVSLTAAGAAHAQATDPYLGQIMCGAFNFAPRGWAELNGQILSIAQNTALFALLGTTYGGDGLTTFALPDMRGRMGVHAGSGPGLSPRDQGETAGAEVVVLNNSQLPAHTHSVTPLGSAEDASLTTPLGAVPGTTKKKGPVYAPAPGTVQMATFQSGVAGSGAPVPVMPPYVTVRCFIALVGVFPPRN